MAGSSDHGWERIGDWTSSLATPNSTAEGRRVWHRYRVSGFGCHTEHKVIEFLGELFATRFCCWAFGLTSGFAVCLVDKETLSVDATGIMPNNAHFKLVRCPSQGCDHVGYLKDLNYHLGHSCAFNLTTCTKCDGSVAHKDMPSHFWTCEGAPGVFLSAADVHSLLEDLGTPARSWRAPRRVRRARARLKTVVVAVTEMFDRMNSQFVIETLACSGPGLGGVDPAQ
ncbi:hypothetical protein HPB51_003812 [Rhipicephalus microplus]|uniref:Uncharacterized protein n=1 Tax=Rhipicephalus microplus TaxID=6941 RepID=A0A9J6EKE2_RHIMP|nr:hypothetical protein HPB51_003812 [Rhipicephalus microplus]